MTFAELLFIFVGGILPALLWLWFWLKEDRLHPEPRRLIILTFFAGMLVVGLALPAEQLIHYIFKKLDLTLAWGGFLLLFFWAFAEEYAKYLAAKKAALCQSDFDEPVDAMIYLITAAIGFAALENVIFLFGTVSDFGLNAGFMTGNLRFTGSTLLHILSSATVGAAISLSFYKQKSRFKYLTFGLILATLFHAFFNFFVIRSSTQDIFQVFIPLWVLIIGLLFLFEKIKRIKK